MERKLAENLLNRIAMGDEEAREQLIEQYRAFIAREASRTCKSNLEWGKDEELSIALLGFNEAIDTYKKDMGSFEALARLIIKRRLIDYFRKNKKFKEASSEDIEKVSYEEDWEVKERAEEIARYRQALAKFDLNFEQVADSAPKHEKNRAILKKAAFILASREDLMDYLMKRRQLPKKELCLLSGTTSRVLERGRVYIIALALLLSGEEFPHLKEYMSYLVGKGGKQDGQG